MPPEQEAFQLPARMSFSWSVEATDRGGEVGCGGGFFEE
jgi:hypothetical protein